MKQFMFTLIGLIGAVANADAKNVGTSGGRFQVIQLSDMRRDQILIDTQTGKTWHWNCYVGSQGADCAYGAWMQDDAENITLSGQKIIDRAEKLEKFKSSRESESK